MWTAAWVVISALCFNYAYAEGTYSVVAPRVLRPNRDFTVVVTTHGTKELVRVTVEVGGSQDSGGVILNRQTAEMSPDSTQTLKFEIGELGAGEYNLTVTGVGGLSFSNSTKLMYEGKSYSVFIETDRGVYKPGDTIKFRAVVVNPFLKPSVTGAIDVYVSDGDGNRVKQWMRVFTNKGVFSGEVLLSEEPVLGQWNITVDVLGQKTSASVLVAEYILPKFEVEVDLPKYVTFEDEQIVATVIAKYTYGRPVKGEVTIQVAPTYKYAYLQAPYDKPISVVKMMKGKTDVTFNLIDDLRLKDDYVRELQFTAYVKEELTQRVQNSSSKITVYKYPYKMQLIRTSDSFKPGLKYTAFLKMAYHDDSPVREGVVIVRHAFSKDQSEFVEAQHQIPPSGIVPLSFYPPLNDDVHNLALEAQFGNLTQWLADLTRAQSPSNSFLQSTLLTQDPKVGGEILVGLNATWPMLYFVYEILGRGDVIYAQTLQAHEGTAHSFRFVATPAMAPRARLVVYYVRKDGEVVADSLHFSVEGAIQNEVSISVNPEVVDAGGDVSITVTTKPNAFVGISAIDQSSLLLRKGNDLTEDGILEELESYDPGRVDAPSPWHYLERRRKRSLYSYHGTTTAADVFKNAGIVVLTNGLVYDYNPYEYYMTDQIYAKWSRRQHPLVSSRRLLRAFVQELDSLRLGSSAKQTQVSGPVDGSALEPERRPPAVNGPFGRAFAPLDSSTLKPDLGPGVVYNSLTRPPLAGPYAFSFLPPPPDDKPRIYLNKALAKPWIFKDASTGFNGVVTLREKAPDSITSYMLNAFAIDDFYGLGVANAPSKLTVFRLFFVSLHLPSSIIRGEAAAVEVVVFNYGNKEVSANVTLFNPGPGDFLFPDFANEIDQGSPASSLSKTVTISAESGTPLSFMIVPQKLGTIDVKVSAVSPIAVDVISQKLMVKPEGTPIKMNRALLVDLRSEQSFTETVNITTPRNIVEGSLDISVSVIGDILGPVVSDLSSLLQLPTGCGEQNMAKMVPNIVLVEYLKNKNQLDTDYLERARRNLELGYQRQLTFRHEDGSFSAFGGRDKSGSTWLTAFVVQSFMMAKRHIDIEDSIIAKATEWIIQSQEADGSFKEKGEINNEAIQGGATGGVPLTAYVAISLIRMQDIGVQGVKNTINRALEYLIAQLAVMEDPYSFAITTYALQSANNPSRDAAFYELESKAKVKDEKKWWEDAPLHKTIESAFESTALDVETTSYALLTYSLRGLVRDAFPILKWLTAQRNQKGGFQSTQDTAVGMQALASMAKLMPNSNPRLEVQIIAGSRGDTVTVNNNNAMMLQRKQITNDTESVMIKARGSGFAIVQVTYSFNVDVTGPAPSFSLDPQVDINTDRNKLQLTLCTGYTNGNSSNMAVLDVSLPSGYVIDNDLIPSLYNFERVKRVEKKENDAGVLLYFDSLTSYEVCPTISAYRVSKVAFQKRAPVIVYDYYDLSRQARQFYEPAPATLCDICDLDECDPNRCEKQIVELNRQLQDPADYYYPGIVEETSGTQSLAPFSCLVFVLISIVAAVAWRN